MDIEALVNSLPDEVVDYIAGLHDENEELTKRLEAVDTPDEPTDPIEKALSTAPPELVALWKADRERAEKLEAEVEKINREKLDEAWIAKAREFDGFVKADEFGPVLRQIADYMPDQADVIVKAFTAAAEQVKTADIYKELGQGTQSVTDAEGQIEVLAKSYRDANPDLDESSARALAWERNPELYTQYVNERH